MKNSPNTDNEFIQSPCIGNCCLDESDICLGCFRQLSEIVAWSKHSKPEKMTILCLCAQRKNARGKV